MKVKVNKIVTREDYSEALDEIIDETNKLNRELNNLYILAAVVIGVILMTAIGMAIAI